MPDNLPSAPENSTDGQAAERAAVCVNCSQERAGLMAELNQVQTEGGPEKSSELSAWVETNFPNVEPTEFALAAVEIFQAEERAFDSTYDVTNDDPLLIETDIRLLAEQLALQHRNSRTTGEIEDGVPTKVPAEAGVESTLIAEEDRLATDQKVLAAAHQNAESTATQKIDTQAEKTDRNIELRRLQTTFDQLRADGISTAKALRHVIAQSENSETKQHLTAILSRVALLQAALPNKPDVVNRLLNSTGLNLASANVSGSFTNFITAAETDEALTEDDRAVLRKVIQREERYARTGTDVQTELGETVTSPDGKIIPAHPEGKPYQFRDDVQGFARTDGSLHLRAESTHGERVTLDITGWPSADVGRASELLQLWAMTENEGQTGYLTSLTKLDWTDTARIDPLALQQASQVVSALLGGGEGHDGDIFDGKDALGMIRWQAQLANQSGEALRGTRDETRTHDALVGFGIRDEKGNLELDVLRAFGNYSRDHWMTAPHYEAVQRHLRKPHSD